MQHFLREETVKDCFEELERMSSIVFVLDRRFQIVYCNEAWDRFAESNGAVQLQRPAPYGVCVLDGVPGFLKNLYRSAYLNAFEYGQAWQFQYECSSGALRTQTHRSARCGDRGERSDIGRSGFEAGWRSHRSREATPSALVLDQVGRHRGRSRSTRNDLRTHAFHFQHAPRSKVAAGFCFCIQH